MEKKPKVDYNEESVLFCEHCLSLGIMSIESQLYCNDCGDTEISEVNIIEWEKLYKDKYGKKHLDEPTEY